MRTFLFKDRYKIDAYGFLLDPQQWDEPFAEAMASEAGIVGGLTDDHWRVLRFVRNSFDKINVCPLIYIACLKDDLGLGDLRRLFPTGHFRGACRLAGISYRAAKTQHLWIEEHLVHYTRLYERRVYQADVLGYLLDPNDWDELFALRQAHETNLPDYLSDRHWQIIYYLRKRFADTGQVASLHEACDANRIDLAELERLFPAGYNRGAVMTAGLRMRQPMPQVLDDRMAQP